MGFGSGWKSAVQSVAQTIAQLVGQDIIANTIDLTVASGSVAVQLTDGARLKLGDGTTDYLTSDGAATISAAGNLTLSAATGTLTLSGTSAVINLNDAGGEYRISNKAVLFGGTTTVLRGLRTDTGGADVGIELVNDEAFTTASDVMVRIRNGESGVGTIIFDFMANGSLVLPSTDSSGTPGNATINQANGRSAIALGASSAVITNSLVSAASHVFISTRTRDATGLLPLVTAIGAGSFTVSTSANCTADLVFDWFVVS